jgi:hypothetical protein
VVWYISYFSLLPLEKYKSVSWKKKEFEDNEALLGFWPSFYYKYMELIVKRGVSIWT